MSQRMLPHSRQKSSWIRRRCSDCVTLKTTKFGHENPEHLTNSLQCVTNHPYVIYGIIEIQIHAFLTSPIRGRDDEPADQPLLVWRLCAAKGWTIWMLYTPKAVATLEPEPTQHNSLDRLQTGARTDTTQESAQTPDRSQNWHNTTVWTDSRQEPELTQQSGQTPDRSQNWHNTTVCTDSRQEPELTQQSGQTPDRSQNRHNTTVWTDSRQESRNQPHYCSCQRLPWNRSDWNVVSQQLPTVWPNKVGLFRTDSLVRHLLQFA